ncbi:MULTISPECIES: GntR family transcriptional regulator [Eubacteriales]|uniref:DNA-binding transcriptional regulator YhcF, GntR family n=1 Tax=Bittarella massiliensis (ex Durand et al. 2017) TaxID=1720313 RepID=A0AAQ1MF13_9FIRM|nr:MULTISPECIES: GntR family transcriptional regulator [Eubacteriales]ERI99854.1 transcriptional regulator, GntR family [Clostridium sp. ATCC 29733]MZL69416.1 GntR family transcriptional regulator [Bittarella massiliensis (ex Durand et al. 2017)]MZL79042.1 GntR family transcriptional regulator [Bittarella massiliensis (ex Durand et al. 2017)]SHG46846.1 DNA-binding transcriptional regulator YhcF, GntR family [Bittarella massiliensis (ex Durand et al. 2017)]
MIVQLNLQCDVPLYLQLRNQIVLQIGEGLAQPGERLPTVRELAAQLGVNAMTVNKAYALLKQEGYLVQDRRAGTAVAKHFPPAADFTAKLERDLSLLTAESGLRGIDEETFLALCRKQYRRFGTGARTAKEGSGCSL